MNNYGMHKIHTHTHTLHLTLCKMHTQHMHDQLNINKCSKTENEKKNNSSNTHFIRSQSTHKLHRICMILDVCWPKLLLYHQLVNVLSNNSSKSNNNNNVLFYLALVPITIYSHLESAIGLAFISIKHITKKNIYIYWVEASHRFRIINECGFHWWSHKRNICEVKNRKTTRNNTHDIRITLKWKPF